MMWLRSLFTTSLRRERLGKNTRLMLKTKAGFLHGFCSYKDVKCPVDKAYGKGLTVA